MCDTVITRDIYARALSMANTGTWMRDGTTGKDTISSEMFALLGYVDDAPESDLKAIFERHIHPDDLELVRSKCKSSIESRIGFDVEFRFVTTTAETRFACVIARPDYAKDGSVLRVIGTFQDITESILTATEQSIRLEMLAALQRDSDTVELVQRISLLLKDVSGATALGFA